MTNFDESNLNTNNLNNKNLSTELLKIKCQQRRLLISTKGKTINGISKTIDPEHPPVWFEKSSFKHAQKLFKTYRVIIQISQLIGLNLVLNFTCGLIPLLVTGNSRTISKLYTRYLSTSIHVKNWFESDPFDRNSKCFRSLRIVRLMHKNVAKKMNTNDGREENGETILWIPQYGMCHAQFSFIGMMTVFPHQLGFHNFTPQDFHSMFHFWRVIGYCLGIDDEYNLCSGSDNEIIELCNQIYFDEWLPVIRKQEEKTGIKMSKGITLAMSRVNPNLNYNSLMLYCSKFLQLDSKNFQLQNFNEKFLYHLYRFLFSTATKSRLVNRSMACIAKIRLKRAIKRQKFHESDLDRLYADITYENDRCPFDVNIYYKSAIDTFYK